MDFLGDHSAGLFGRSNQIIAEAIGEAMTKGWNFGGPNSYERKLASKVSDREFSNTRRAAIIPLIIYIMS